MEAMRITQRPKKGLITIKLPERLSKTKLVEVIILPVEEDAPKKTIEDIRKLKSSIKMKMSLNEVEQECEKMREEWNKDF